MATLAQATSRSVEELGLVRKELNPESSVQRPDLPPHTGLQFTRCPVPPISISPDSVKMFGQGGIVPQDRLMTLTPLFQDHGSSGSTAVTNNISVSGGTSTSITSSSTALTAQTTALVTSAISQGVPFATTIQMARSFLLIRISVDTPSRVEFYSTASAQQNDLNRVRDVPVPLGSPTDIIADFYLSQPEESVWICSPGVVGFNGDTPSSSTVYVTVTNLTETTKPITVSLVYVPLES